jgi:hypothetical protein
MLPTTTAQAFALESTSSTLSLDQRRLQCESSSLPRKSEATPNAVGHPETLHASLSDSRLAQPTACCEHPQMCASRAEPKGWSCT